MPKPLLIQFGGQVPPNWANNSAEALMDWVGAQLSQAPTQLGFDQQPILGAEKESCFSSNPWSNTKRNLIYLEAQIYLGS